MSFFCQGFSVEARVLSEGSTDFWEILITLGQQGKMPPVCFIKLFYILYYSQTSSACCKGFVLYCVQKEFLKQEVLFILSPVK